MSATKVAEEIEQLPASMLEEAFQRFSRSSALLQKKYEMLLQETEALREQLHQKDQEIQRAERLATLGKTAAGLAHEIRNPLGAIRLFTSLLKQDVSDRPESLELVENIESSIISLDHVVLNILQFSKNQSPKFGPVNLHALLMEQIEEIKGRFPELIVEHNMQGNPFLEASEHALRQVLRNILLNASQAVRHSGKICLCTGVGKSGEILLECEDDGAGLTPEIAANLFDPFVTSRNEGTGLGLAIVHQIIEQHGGRVSADNESTLGGARFRIFLPRSQAGERKSLLAKSIEKEITD